MVSCITCNVFHMRQFCRFFYCLAWFDIVEFNLLPCRTNRMYDDAVFAHRFRYQLTKFGIRLLIPPSRLLPAHIAYEIDNAKMIAAFIPISYCLHDLIRLNSIVCHVQTTKCTMMRCSWPIPLSIEYVWNSCIDRAILAPSCSYCI